MESQRQRAPVSVKIMFASTVFAIEDQLAGAR